MALTERHAILFMDDTILSEVWDVSNHTSGTCLGNFPKNVDRVACFAHEERMELNAKKWLLSLGKIRQSSQKRGSETNQFSW